MKIYLIPPAACHDDRSVRDAEVVVRVDADGTATVVKYRHGPVTDIQVSVAT